MKYQVVLIAALVLAVGGQTVVGDPRWSTLPVDWQLCAPCVSGGTVEIIGTRLVQIDDSPDPDCVQLRATYRTGDAVAVFPDGSVGGVTGLETVSYDYCHSHTFLIHVYFNITDANGRRYTYREVRSGDQGEPVQIGGDCTAFQCLGL